MWLHFGQGLDRAQTAPLRLEDLASGASNAPALQLATELAAARREACDPEAPVEHRLRWCERYLMALRSAGGGRSSCGQLQCQWTAAWESPRQARRCGPVNPAACSALVPDGAGALPPPPPPPLCPVASPLAEEVMACHLYAALLQELARRRRALLLPGAAAAAAGELPGAAGMPSGSASAGGSTGERRRWGGRALLRRILSISPRSRAERGGGSGGGSRVSSPRRAGSPAASSPDSSCHSGGSSPVSPFLVDGRCQPWDAAAAAAARWDAAGGSDASAAGAAQPSAAALYRRAAGVYQHVAQQLLPAAQAAGALPAVDGPVELWPGVAEAMAQMCLGQAQGVAALRAAAKGTSPALLAALHVGAAGLFKAASAAFEAVRPPLAGNTRVLSPALYRFLAASALGHTAAARRQQAEHHRAQDELGVAVASMRSAVAVAREAAAVCAAGQDEEWRAALAAEVAALERLHARMDKERDVVHVQREAAEAPVLPQGKVIVAPAEFELAPPADS